MICYQGAAMKCRISNKEPQNFEVCNRCAPPYSGLLALTVGFEKRQIFTVEHEDYEEREKI